MGDGKRNGADIMNHSVWLRLKTAEGEWTHQGRKLQTEWCLYRLPLFSEQFNRCLICFYICWRTEQTVEKATRRKSFSPLALKHTLPTAQLADQGTSHDSSATGFLFFSCHQGSVGLCYTPCCPLENEDRCFNGLEQFDLQVLCSPLLITPPAPGLTPGIIDTVNSWKGTARFRCSPLLYLSYSNSAYRG